MTTQYTPILKLALPVTGELSGTWGDVVNDNITSMVEQAIAGLATISTWSANSHTLTTANGTTSESRCAMLVAQNGAGLAAAGEIVCPASSKLYVLKNDTSYAITLKTAAGTGVAVASGNTAFLFCDGTNVNACVTTIVDGRVTGNLTVDGNATVNGNTTLGNATSDTITATARFASGLTPSADNTYDLGSTGNSWKDLYIDGTAYLALVDINGGTIDGVSIGASTAATIINVDNLRLDGNTISSTDTNGNVVIAPNGTGDVQLDADTVRVGDSGAAATLTSNGAGALTVTTGGAANLVLSTNSGTDSGTITIANGANGNISIVPNGTGDVQLDADTVRIGDANTDVTLTSNGTGNLNLSTNGGTNSGTIQIAQGANASISLTPNGTGTTVIKNPSISGTTTFNDGNTNQVIYLNASKQATTSANLTFDGTTLTAAGFADSSLTSGRVTYATTGGNLTDSANLTFDGTTLGTTGLSNSGNTTLGDATSDTLTVNALVNSNLLFTDATYTIGSGAANRPAAIFLASNNASFNTPITAANLASGGGGFGLSLFAGSVGNAVAGDSLIFNGVGNLIISPNAASKKLVFVAGSWTNTPTLTIDSTNLLVNTQTNATASPNLYLYGTQGTLATFGGLNHYSAGGNNNGFIGGAYYNTSGFVIATHTKSAQYQNYEGSHIFYTNTGLTVGNSYTNVRRASIDENGVNIVGPLTAARTNFYSSLTPFWQAEGSSNTGLRAASLVYNSNASTGPLFALAKSRGTTEGSVTAVQIGDELGQYNWLGTDGTRPILGASITAYVEGTVSTNNVPSKLSLQTGGTSATIYPRYEITNTGKHYWQNVSTNSSGSEMWLDGGLFVVYNNKIENRANTVGGFDAYQIYGAGHGTNQKYWRQQVINGSLQWQTLNDAYNVQRTYMTVERSGVDPTAVFFSTGSSSTSRLWIGDNGGNGAVVVGATNALSSDNRFAVSNAGTIGFEVGPGTVSGFSTSVRLLSYDRNALAYRTTLYSALAHNFNISGNTNNVVTISTENLSVNPEGLTPSYTGFLQVSRNSTQVGRAVASFQQNGATSSEDVNITAINGSYSNQSTPGWGMLRLLVDRGPSSVFNYLTCVAGGNTGFQLRGDGNAYADGTWNNNGADYAEYFESASGQEIPVGTSVVLDGNKVRPATAQDTNILGAVRPKKDGINSMVVGNTAWGGWANKYLMDDFGCFIMEDVTLVEWTETLDEWAKHPDPAMGTEGVKKTKFHQYSTDKIPDGVVVPADAVYKTHDSDGVKLERRKLNPAWDESVKYVPREKRPEWLIIGLLGQIRILKGQPTGSNWVKMRDISASVEEWFVK